MSGYQGIFLFGFLLFLLGALLVIANNFFALRRFNPAKFKPYECGIDVSWDARIPLKVKFYLIAVIFLVFDVELVFLYPWAVVFEDLGWFGFVEIAVFVFLLLVAYVYAWREGALKWE
ncbi:MULTISPECIES: NADH-quinone oxidoreductase subunit A [Thermodesulfobacterium]|jgi:NADH-quinone oxidoreductase subunit A|uniref:NADH-quinone oxidoreductase subunit A n=2 Tax=Thermodesulfobacterium commune TaxID=1741 RepID=A0A075WTN1_9BACT|nr:MULTISPECIES: NADH-quinone oxidoreductase subunit A [Thermodesulfobacterium]KUJ97979.1 MAG: NADH-quinone oxidoreductase subunit A [Thermodesulfobacterium sp. 37_54]KUK19105.1 MAG: NADH-quinone oxidoreductase subunit A [Thermodesulfobacterium commune]AIH04340.1 NADH-quinone oxidoreductase [Thermodesulfobacterium commune DSM 2178]KUK38179.1 MAG: NADH-quinone oxidoreductase subunit A [Thermodesulfobacterium commune]MBZ4681563.1 NADH-quinone oxidoreductase [Thermodesulfobacterium sp.]